MLKIPDDLAEARDFKKRADLVDSLYFAGQKLQEKENISVPTAAVTKKINLNSANLEQLMQLPKIGQVTAQRIIDYRRAHGGFKNVNELLNVKGIGEKTLERLKNEVSIE